MNVRSNINPPIFYPDRIAATEALQAKTLEQLRNGLVATDRIPSVKRMLFSQYLHLAIRKYSGGFPIPELNPDFQSALALAKEVWPDDGNVAMPDYLKDWYGKMLWLLTLGIFLGVSDEDFDKAVAAWDACHRKDWLVEYLIGYRIPGRPPVQTLLFPKPYSSLQQVVKESDPVRRSGIVRRYLEKEWYPGHKGVYWYDNHKSPHDVFFGYWSFEAAAVVKIAGIDDSSFRDNPYYPKDMLG